MWWDTLPPDLREPLGTELAGDIDADVAIVGAGYTGLWTAYYLLEADPSLRVAIVEAQAAGFGASGRNGGWASALFPASMATMTRAAGRDEAIRMARTMQASIDEIARVITAERWDAGWHKGGTVVYARSAQQWARAKQEIDTWRGFGFGADDYALLDRHEALALGRMTDAMGATYTPHCAAVHPARLVRSLARTVARRGARIYERTAATQISAGLVRTQGGTVRAPIVLRATEAYSKSLSGMQRDLAPVYSLMIATEPLPAATWREIGLEGRPTFSDGRHLIVYGQRTADDRLAFGGRGAPYHLGSRISDNHDRNEAVHRGLWEVVRDMFPAVSGARVTHAWGGPLGIARDWWASVDFDPATGLGRCGGYVGDGVTTSNLGGRTLADLVLRRQTDLVTLPWVGHRSPRWEPEPLRWLGANAGLRAMTHADATESRTGRPSIAARAMGRFLGH